MCIQNESKNRLKFYHVKDVAVTWLTYLPLYKWKGAQYENVRWNRKSKGHPVRIENRLYRGITEVWL